MKNVNVFTEGITPPEYKISTGYIKKTAVKIIELIDFDFPDCSIIITNNSFIRSINSQYRNKDAPTDVISFPADTDMLPEGIEGQISAEIYISIEKAEEQAVEAEVSLKNELNRLLVHGLLHVAGYDHELSDEEEKLMFETEDLILKKIESQSK